MKYLLYLLMPLSLFATHEKGCFPPCMESPIIFYYNFHSYIKFTEYCVIHDPDCGCDDIWSFIDTPEGWILIKDPTHLKFNSLSW